LKEDLGKAKKEISDVTRAVKESINDRGDDNRNFFGQLREIRLNETVNNIAGERLKKADKSEDIVSAWKDAYKDLGYNLDVKYTTGEDTPEMKNKAGTAYVSESGVHTIILNINAEENQTKAGLIGTLAEEASHIVNGVAGRQIETGTEEKGLESTGRAANAYFKEKYKDSKQGMTYVSDGKIDTSKLGTNVGDDAIYIGPKFNAGPIFQGGVGFGGYLINTGKGFQVGFGISGSVGGATGAGISGGGDIVYYPYAKDKSDVSKNYFSVNIAVQHKILLGGSLGVTAYIPLKNGNLDFSSNGIGIGLSAEAFAGMGLEGIGASSNYSTGVNYWMTDFSGKMANMISNEIEKLKKDYNLTGLTNEAMKYLTGHKKDIEKLFKKKGKR
jgi:putative hemagglutination activity domain protein